MTTARRMAMAASGGSAPPPPPFPTIKTATVTDHFVDANGVLLPAHALNLGGPWVTADASSDLEIDTNQAWSDDTTQFANLVACGNMAAGYASVTTPTIGSVETCKLLACTSGSGIADNTLAIQAFTGSGHWRIVENVGFASPHFFTTPLVATSGDTIELRWSGLAAQAWINGVMVDAWTLSAPLSSDMCGIANSGFSAGTDTRFDDFEAGTLS